MSPCCHTFERVAVVTPADKARPACAVAGRGTRASDACRGGGPSAVCDFALHRIRRVTMTEPYEIPGDFDARAYLGEAFAIEKGAKGAHPMEVAIRFAPRQARWIRERRWHRSARVQDAIDGGCVLRMRAAGLGAVKRWVLQFGAEAEVLKPASLRRELVGELEMARGCMGNGDCDISFAVKAC
jgi:predicted DNA-binding transcriptional regulator YafY